ncbi:MAG: type VI secretion system contractile sheath large subunit [Polyangiaceae bacterium]
MSGKDEEKGGIALGGISFGVTGPSAQVASDERPAEAGKIARAPAGAPMEIGSDVMLPVRMVVIADLLPRAEHHAGADPPDRPLRVTVGEPDRLFEQLAPKLAMEVESVLEDGKRVRVDFAPRSLTSFRPDQLTQDIPLLKALLDGRRELERLREGTSTVEQAGLALQRLWNNSSLCARVLGGVETSKLPDPAAAAAPPPEPPGASAVDRILDMVDMGGGGAAAPSEPAAAPPAAPAAGGGGRFGAFIAAVAHSGKARGSVRPDEALALVDKALGHQLGAILQHPELRRLEQAWRGLFFLLGRAPKTGLVIDVVAAREGEEAAALQKAIDAAPGVDPPVSFAVVDTTIDGRAHRLAQLRELADTGEANVVPVILNAAPGLFGQDHLEAVDRLDNKASLFEAPERAPWRAEANRPAMLWTALCLNRMLGRVAYDARSARLRGTEVAEMPADPAEATVWLSPCWAVGALCLESVKRTGWPCQVSGAPRGGIVEDLPVRDFQVPGTGETIAIPTEVFLSTESQRALGRLGLLALASQPNSDAVYVLSAATAYVTPPKRTMTDESAEAAPRLPQTPLGDQLFVARLAQFLQALGGRIGAQAAPAEVEAVLHAAVHELFAVAPPPGPEIAIDVSSDGGALHAAVTVRPRRFLGVGTEEITLGVPLG